MAGFDAGAKELLDIMETTIPQIEDAALLLRKFKDKYDIDPQRLTELDERLDLIKRLEKKYGEGVDAILKYRGTSEEELNGLVTAEERQESLQAGLDAKENEIKAMSDRLSDKRIAAAKKMEKAILGELHDLGFQKADFKVDIKKRIDISAHGMDDVEFLFSANPGEPPRPLIKVASGGELSRIMLALKCMETSHQPAVESSKLRTLIFDEVDAGIGGVTAQHVGKRLKEIAGNYQVLCITHLPQIAALADNHLKVEKIMGSDAVKVNVEPLTGGKRHDEIARMLSGKITDSSLKHARELLGARI